MSREDFRMHLTCDFSQVEFFIVKTSEITYEISPATLITWNFTNYKWNFFNKGESTAVYDVLKNISG